MKFVMKLARNGNATTITIPRAMLRAMRWQAGDAMILEVSDVDTLRLHPPRAEDLRTASPVAHAARLLESVQP